MSTPRTRWSTVGPRVAKAAAAAAAAVHLSWPTNRSISPQPMGLTDDGDELLLGRITHSQCVDAALSLCVSLCIRQNG